MNKTFTKIFIISAIFPILTIHAMDGKKSNNLLDKSPLDCPTDYPIIKISNQSGMDIKIKTTYGHFDSVHILPLETSESHNHNHDKYYNYGKKVEIVGKSIIIPKGTAVIIKPKRLVRHRKAWKIKDMHCITKLSARPIMHGNFAKIKSRLNSSILSNVEELHTNYFVVSKTNGKLFFIYKPNRWKKNFENDDDILPIQFHESEFSDCSQTAEISDSLYEGDKEDEFEELIMKQISRIKCN